MKMEQTALNLSLCLNGGCSYIFTDDQILLFPLSSYIQTALTYDGGFKQQYLIFDRTGDITSRQRRFAMRQEFLFRQICTIV